MYARENSPIDVLRYDTIVRVTLYRASTDAPELNDRFLAAWKAESARNVIPGVLYRELCRQRPEWNAFAAKEIEHPIDAAFLEYLVAEPQTRLGAVPAMPQGLAEHFTLLQDLHTVAFRFKKEDLKLPIGALMFNLFEIDGPPGMEQGFLMDWPPRGEFKINESATKSTVLHQRMLPGARIKAFNRAEVVSAEAYAEGINRFEAAFPRAARAAAAGPRQPGAKPPIRSHLGLFEQVAVGPSGATSRREEMKAIVYESFGGPAVLESRPVNRPEPGPGQIRVKVFASAINPLDVKMRSGEVRHIYPSFFPDVVGYSVSGVVNAVGEGVTGRAVGEEVYGINNPIMRHGYAEFLVAPESNFYPKPASLDFPAAAAAPSIFATAFGALFLRANLQAGQTLLIHGGSGVIGSCAVQLARQAGARVIATASTANVGRVRQLGADVVVDYRTQRFEDFAKDVDMVLDMVGGETRERSWGLLHKGGVLASLLPPPPDSATADAHGVRAFMVHGHPNISEIMPEMTRRLESGELAAPEIAAIFPLGAAAEAHAAFEANPPRGRIVLVTEHWNRRL
jgi:NADPH:quinone reductase-like Zn-dependent oxidoreductase